MVWVQNDSSRSMSRRSIPWQLFDHRFAHARLVTQIEIVSYEPDGDYDDDFVYFDVEVRETDASFQARLAAEEAARATN